MSRGRGEFFEKYFGFRCIFERDGRNLAVLRDESGFILGLSNLTNVDKVEYPGIFHIGFMQDSRERVDEIYRRLTADGIDAGKPKEFHGAWTFYFRAREASKSRSATSTSEVKDEGGRMKDEG